MSPLSYAEHNPEGGETIVFLHGLFSSGAEYDFVVGFLPQRYHLLIPDLPGHSRSSKLPLTTLQGVAEHIATLIQERAHRGRAHVVGLSFGGYAALTICELYPELVFSCIATGATRFPDDGVNIKIIARSLPVLVPLIKAPGMISYISGFPVPYPALAHIKRNMKQTLARSGLRILRTEFERKPIPTRTLLCAGSLADPVLTMVDFLAILQGKGGNSESDAVVVINLYHSWDLQDPSLFADLVVAWIERSEFPVGVVKLTDWMKGNTVIVDRKS